MDNGKGRPYKEINELYWNGVQVEQQDPMKAKQFFERVEDLENEYRKKRKK
jgi:hypothetical protein